MRFTGAWVHHLHSNSSYHRPILIVPTRLEVDRKKKIFRFEKMWLSDKGCAETVEAMWLSRDFEQSNSRVLKKIEKCGVELIKWSQENFGSVKTELEMKHKC